ncbi:MAG: hypothetical protein K2K60_05315, partial [Clostridia bacterium]|nr:hypothetical protein [Clostridia bacterium]
MEIQETKNPKKYAAVITYTIAVVFLLAGLLIPLTAGKEMLALCYPDVFKALMKGAESEFILAYPVVFFGIGKKVIDISAWISILYLVVTAVAMIGFIPVGISTKKQTRTASIFAYVVETAAVILLSIWLIILLQALPEVKFSYNVIIALFGTLLMLVILSCINKRGIGGVKVALLILSAIAFLMLFDWIAMIPKLGKPLDKISGALKISPLFYGMTQTAEGVTITESTTGVGYLSALFESKYITEALKFATAAKQKALLVLALIAALSVLLNYFIDVIGLSTNAKKYGHIFNVARYGIEIAAVVCLMVTVAVCKYKVGLLLIVILIAVAIQLAISIARLYRYIVTNRTPEQIADIEARKVARARAREERQALAIAEREREEAERERIAAEKAAEKQAAAAQAQAQAQTQPQTQPVVVESEPVSQTEAAPRNTVTQYPDNYQQAEPAPAKEPYVNPYTPPVRKPVEQPVQPPRYTNPYAAPSAPEQYVNPYAAPTHQPVRKPYESQYVNPYATQRDNFPSYTTPAQPGAYKVNTVYQGPSDEFMRKLNNDEKIEFSMTFIEKSKGDIGKVPDYVIGGDNKKFFSSVFIYLGRVRNLISDGLLNKMYKELN